MTPNTGIWSDFGPNEVGIWSEFGQNLVRIWSEWGWNMVGIWSEWGRNEVRMGLEWGRNEVRIWSEYGRKWSKNTSFFNSDSARNDSEKLGMAKNLSLNFFYFFTWNEVGIWLDSYHSAQIRSECVGEGKVLGLFHMDSYLSLWPTASIFPPLFKWQSATALIALVVMVSSASAVNPWIENEHSPSSVPSSISLSNTLVLHQPFLYWIHNIQLIQDKNFHHIDQDFQTIFQYLHNHNG